MRAHEALRRARLHPGEERHHEITGREAHERGRHQRGRERLGEAEHGDPDAEHGAHAEQHVADQPRRRPAHGASDGEAGQRPAAKRRHDGAVGLGAAGQALVGERRHADQQRPHREEVHGQDEQQEDA